MAPKTICVRARSMQQFRILSFSILKTTELVALPRLALGLYLEVSSRWTN
jgi:hypothetical protein